MKTTVELPDALMREIKIRAVSQGRKLKDVMADLLRKGLSPSDPGQPPENAPYLTRDERSGLPLIRCRHAAEAGEDLTPDRAARILCDQEEAWHEEAGRQ